VISVVGARPQFIKLSPMDAALRRAGHEHVIVHTGQHYAPELSGDLFDDLAIPQADVNLEVGSGSHATQTAAMLTGLEKVFEQIPSDWILVYGDTNSTLSAALAAVKLHRPIAHLEAGLRSGNRLMPEEHNRVVTDHLADLLLAPTETAMSHLAAEGLAGRAIQVGDVMADVCLRIRDLSDARPPAMPPAWSADAPAVLATIHRAENTDDPERLRMLIDRLDSAPYEVLLVAHPRLVAKARDAGIALEGDRLRALPSMTYSQMVYAASRAPGIITDSGGLQKEAFLLETPCVTARSETEWPETLEDGWNVIDPDLESDLVTQFTRAHVARRSHPFGRGDAAPTSVEALSTWSGRTMAGGVG
jgi:UDP-N-acetylglucosamine 2-epimerase (non-hydrolysing)